MFVWASRVVLVVKNPPASIGDKETRVGKIPVRGAWQPTPVFLLENPMDKGVCWVTDHGVAKSHT